MDDFARKISTFSRDRLALLCTEFKARLDRVESASREPIAIVGMACRFPGGVTDADSYWELLRKGVDAITEVPPDRWDVDAFYDPDPDAPGKTYSRVAGHLDEVARFDPFFFNISPREAVSLDPQYRLLLEVTWEALENAGLNPQELRGSRTAVIVGIGADDYAKIQVRSADPDSITAYTGTGNAYCYGAGRLSYFLGLHGPNFPVDTACSSSLVATHVACRSLRTRECDLAIAGGVHLILSPIGSIFLSKARALSPTGRCRTFDASADGFTRGEGCGIIVLKRLSDALADRDRIHAIIRGSAINHDGPSSGFTVPNGMAQRAVIQAALKDAGVGPLDVSFVEAHSTSTSLGDPIEVRALAAVLGRGAGRTADHPLALGAVRRTLATLSRRRAWLIDETVLALQQPGDPPQVHLKEVNPRSRSTTGPS
jgi:acyl transferase domain-containing protein